MPPNCTILIKFKSNSHIGRCCTTKKSTHLYFLKERNVPQNEIAFFNKDQSKIKINMKRTVKISD